MVQDPVGNRTCRANPRFEGSSHSRSAFAVMAQAVQHLLRIQASRHLCRRTGSSPVIRKAVENASDKEIGLPFQLKILFGEDGKALSEKLAGHYEELKN